MRALRLRGCTRPGLRLLVDDFLAEIDAFVADIHRARARDQSLDLILVLSAEGTVVLDAAPAGGRVRHAARAPSALRPLPRPADLASQRELRRLHLLVSCWAYRSLRHW